MTELTAARTIETITVEIKALQNQTLGCIIEIGRRLCEAKEMLPHGEFGEWLKNEVDFSQSSANGFMKAFREFGSPQNTLFGAELNSQTFANLSYTKALKLLALPENEREEFAEEHDLENMSTRDIDKLIKELKEAKQALADADEGAAFAIAEANERTEKATQALKDKETKVRELADQIAEMKAAPIDVTVAPEPDPEKLQAAIEKAAEEARAEKKKEIEELEKKLKAAEKEKGAAEKAKEAAESEKQKANEALAGEKAKTDSAERALESLKKAQAMSDPIVTEFKTLFNEVQRMLKRLKELAGTSGENKERLEGAMSKLFEAYVTGGEAGT